MYPVHIVNNATWHLYQLKGQVGETYRKFLNRVHTELVWELETACKQFVELETLNDTKASRQGQSKGQ